MNKVKLARLSALALLLFLTSLSAFAQRPCGCDYCQRFPERNCSTGGVTTTCAQFLTVALCPPAPPPATSENALSSEESFLAAISGTAQQPAGCLSPAN